MLTLQRIIELMKIEKECVKRADTCGRDCANCELVQEDHDLISAYDYVISRLQEEPVDVMNEHQSSLVIGGWSGYCPWCLRCVTRRDERDELITYCQKCGTRLRWNKKED